MTSMLAGAVVWSVFIVSCASVLITMRITQYKILKAQIEDEAIEIE